MNQKRKSKFWPISFIALLITAGGYGIYQIELALTHLRWNLVHKQKVLDLIHQHENHTIPRLNDLENRIQKLENPTTQFFADPPEKHAR